MGESVKKVLIPLLTLIVSSAFAADITVESADIKAAKKNESRLIIKHSGVLKSNPKINIVDNKLTLTIPEADLKTQVNANKMETVIGASMTASNEVVINLDLPYSLEGKESSVTIALKDNAIEVNYPKLKSEKKEIKKETISRAPSVVKETPVVAKVEDDKEALKFDENYLEALTKKEEIKVETKKVEEKIAATVLESKDKSDKVGFVQSAVTKKEESKNNESSGAISVAGYVGKFVVFLTLMIGALYGVLMMFKKGVIKKGKLGFLNSTNLVEVLNTTHIGPKRNLMMVRAHKQVFLISNSEAGVQLILEVKDIVGLMKTGEAELTGSNFDLNLNDANKSEKEFKLKEVQKSTFSEDYALSSLDDLLDDTVSERPSKTSATASLDRSPIEDQVRISDLVKNKVKNLKQL